MLGAMLMLRRAHLAGEASFMYDAFFSLVTIDKIYKL